MKSDIVADNF